MMTSLRFRLFLAATATVAVVLTFVMATGWKKVMDFETARLDLRLCSEAKRLAIEHFSSNERERLDVDILGKLHLTSPDQLLLWVESSTPEQNYRSPKWDNAVMDQALNWPPTRERVATDEPPPRGERGSPGQNDCALTSFKFQGSMWRAARAAQRAQTGVVAANLAAPQADIQGALSSALSVIIPLALVLTAIGAGLLSTIMIRPVNRLRESMKAVTPRDMNQRLAQDGEASEFQDLINAYNTMLERLERSFLQASRFSADAAHELKTPLTVLRGRIESAIRKADTSELQDELLPLLDEVGRLSSITRKLLLLSQADAGRLELNREPVDLTGILNGLLSDVQMIIGKKQLSHSVQPHLIILGDAVLLQQLLNNLLSNALRYSNDDGNIDIRASQVNDRICIDFSNACHPISAEQRQSFFVRFFRGESSHNRQVEGNGLGLSLALEIAKAHGGTLTLQPSANDTVHLLLDLPVK